MKDKTLLITGGTGSLGTAFSKKILKKGIKKLIIYSRDWQKQNNLKEELREYNNIRFFIGDVRDRERLKIACKNVDYIIHAAAIKCIEACEYNTLEATKTNILGTQNVVEAAIENRVKQTVLISTDKAVNPINTYGITKAMSEKIIINGNKLSANDKIFFNVVRYGNVVGSNGSVIPKYIDMIQKGYTTLPVTDNKCTRFWFEMEQAIELIERAFNNNNTYILIPRMKSFRVIDIIQALGCKHTSILGLRQNEKIHEEIEIGFNSNQENNFVTVDYIKNYIRSNFNEYKSRNL